MIVDLARKNGRGFLMNCVLEVEKICSRGGTPLAVIRDNEVLGVVQLKIWLKVECANNWRA